MSKITSKIKSIKKSPKDESSYSGFIRSLDGGKDYFFTKADIGLAITELEVDNVVEFIPVEKDQKRFVSNLKIVKPEVVNAPISIDYAIKESITYSSYVASIITAMKNINLITDSADFEDACFLLIKNLGVHNIYQFERNNQAGKADGFFCIENLAIMYDCTLRSEFEEYKAEQIENYINKLNQKSQLTIDIKKMDGGNTTKTIQISGKTKQVWIITKKESREMTDHNGIKVKEIAIKDLLSIFEKRMNDTSYDIDKLVNDFMLLGK